MDESQKFLVCLVGFVVFMAVMTPMLGFFTTLLVAVGIVVATMVVVKKFN